ncbi:MAG: DnaJ domain-containing protein [Verrucomicrobiota bacterium]|nr:DnaJ domain-containing protein [Verrucomicrobiota bacterium]
MTDYFALLNQPRAPWLDPHQLKDAYHRQTLQTHPDTRADRAGADQTDASFARLNEAYQVLQDPKRRLHHLLSLEGCAPSSADQTVPKQLHNLFPAVGSLTQRANLLLQKIQGTSNALSRSLLKPQLLELQKETTEIRSEIQDLSDASLAELREINTAWPKNSAQQIEDLSNLYFAFAYLTRWSSQLDELAFQLSQH